MSVSVVKYLIGNSGGTCSNDVIKFAHAVILRFSRGRPDPILSFIDRLDVSGVLGSDASNLIGDSIANDII